MLSENDISAVDSFLKDSGIVEILEPWHRIKTALAELGTTPNIGSPKLVALANRAISQLETMSLHQALDTITELRNQLRAGA